MATVPVLYAAGWTDNAYARFEDRAWIMSACLGRLCQYGAARLRDSPARLRYFRIYAVQATWADFTRMLEAYNEVEWKKKTQLLLAMSERHDSVRGWHSYLAMALQIDDPSAYADDTVCILTGGGRSTSEAIADYIDPDVTFASALYEAVAPSRFEWCDHYGCNCDGGGSGTRSANASEIGWPCVWRIGYNARMRAL